jgi:hypothetical protein
MCYEYEFWRKQREEESARRARQQAEEVIRKAREKADGEPAKHPEEDKEPAAV